MPNLRVQEIKAFVPAKNYTLSKQFYQDLGFSMVSDGGGVAYFLHGNSSFLLQDYYEQGLANNLMMHLQVEDVDAWWTKLTAERISERYGIKMGIVEQRPWGMKDFTLIDPSGVLWRIAQNDD